MNLSFKSLSSIFAHRRKARSAKARRRRRLAFAWQQAEPMEPRLVLSPVVQQLGNGIQFTQDPGRRLSSIRVDGNEILQSGGIYLIASGSTLGRDVPETNFESILGTNGYMRNARGEKGPRFELTFAKKNANTITFKVKVWNLAKSNVDQVSLAMDFQRNQIGRFEVPNATRMKFSSTAPGDTDRYRDGGRFRFEDIEQNLAIKNSRGVVLAHVGTALTRNQNAMKEFSLIGRRAILTVRLTRAENVNELSFANHDASHSAGYTLVGESAVLEGEITIQRR